MVTASSTIIPPPPADTYPSMSALATPLSSRTRCIASTWCWTPSSSGATG